MLVAFPCPNCQKQQTRFEIGVTESASIRLQAVCHPCKTIIQVVLACQDLVDLGKGNSVAVIEQESAASYVM